MNDQKQNEIKRVLEPHLYRLQTGPSPYVVGPLNSADVDEIKKILAAYQVTCELDHRDNLFLYDSQDVYFLHDGLYTDADGLDLTATAETLRAAAEAIEEADAIGALQKADRAMNAIRKWKESR